MTIEQYSDHADAPVTAPLELPFPGPGQIFGRIPFFFASSPWFFVLVWLPLLVFEAGVTWVVASEDVDASGLRFLMTLSAAVAFSARQRARPTWREFVSVWLATVLIGIATQIASASVVLFPVPVEGWAFDLAVAVCLMLFLAGLIPMTFAWRKFFPRPIATLVEVGRVFARYPQQMLTVFALHVAWLVAKASALVLFPVAEYPVLYVALPMSFSLIAMTFTALFVAEVYQRDPQAVSPAWSWRSDGKHRPVAV